MSLKRLAILGGGIYIPRLVETLAGAAPADFGPLEIRVGARRFDRLDTICRAGQERLSEIRPDWRLIACEDIDKAIDAVDAVVLLIRFGGLEARAHDESFPTRAGLVGDEGIGVGGIANAWRTLPELVELGRRIERLAPSATILNMIAPLGLTTRVLLDEGLSTLGVCELPLVSEERFFAGAEDAHFQYLGFNHLGWFWPLDERARLALDAARERGEVDAATLERFGAAPLHYFYEVIDPAAGRRLGRIRRPGRARELAAMSEAFIASDDHDASERKVARATPWFDRALIPNLISLATGSPFRSYANLRNGGLVPELPESAIIEVAAEYEGADVRTSSPGEVPAEVMAFLKSIAEVEELAYRAARERNRDLVAEAIEALPMRIRKSDVAPLVAEVCRPLDPGGVRT